MTDSSSASVPNPFTSLFWFFVITTIYFVFKYNNSDKVTGVPDPTNSKIYGGIYILLLIIGEFIINLNLTDSMCGTKQYDTALFITIIPWVVIFGLLYVVLSVFPGWLAPFSNTFGYGVAKLSGITSFLNFILKNTNDLGKETDDKVSESLQHIYSDKSLLINEITPENFNVFWEDMSPLFKDGIKNNADMKAQLFSFIRLKDIVAEYIWYLLTGILVTSVGYNYLVNNGCSQNAKDMKKKHKEYIEKEQQNAAANANKQQRVYTLGD